MPNLAKITVMGHIGQDPRTPMQDKPEFVTFSLAVTDKWKDKNTGERQTRTDWYDCITSKTALANVIKNYVKQGAAVYVEGKPKFSTYTAKNGDVKVKVEINIDNLVLLGGDKQEQQSKDNNKIIDQYSYLDDEIPF